MPIKKRKKKTSEYVFIEEGHLIVQPPSSCSRWPSTFKLRLSRDWIAPETLCNRGEFLKEYVENGLQDKVYRIDGVNLFIKNLSMSLQGNSRKLVITKTVVTDADTGDTIDLIHDDFLMRIMQVYVFVSGDAIGGVPELPIYRL